MLAFILAALTTVVPAPVAPVPVDREPYHRTLFQNNFVRVLDVQIPPGQITKYHIHASPLITVFLLDARTSAQILGEAPGPVSSQGAVPNLGDNWNQSLPYTHRVKNVGSVSSHGILAEWLAPAGPQCVSLGPIPGYSLAREGKFGRAYKVQLRPGESTPRHSHSCPGLTVQGTAGRLRNMGTPPAAQGGSGAGHWLWRNAGHQHVLSTTARRQSLCSRQIGVRLRNHAGKHEKTAERFCPAAISSGKSRA